MEVREKQVEVDGFKMTLRIEKPRPYTFISYLNDQFCAIAPTLKDASLRARKCYEINPKRFRVPVSPPSGSSGQDDA